MFLGDVDAGKSLPSGKGKELPIVRFDSVADQFGDIVFPPV